MHILYRLALCLCLVLHPSTSHTPRTLRKGASAEAFSNNITRLEAKGEPKSGTTFLEIAVYAAAKVALGVEQHKGDGRHITYRSNIEDLRENQETFFFTEKQKHYVKDIYRFNHGTECTYDIERSWLHGPWTTPQNRRTGNTTKRVEQRQSRPVGCAQTFECRLARHIRAFD